MAAEKRRTFRAAGSLRRREGVAAVRRQPRARNRHYAERVERRLRLLDINAAMAMIVAGGTGVLNIVTAPGAWPAGAVNIAAAAIFALIPLLHDFGELVAPLTFVCTAYVSIFVVCWEMGTASGMEFYFLVAACLVMLQLGIEHVALAATLAAAATGLVIALEFLVPRNTGVQPSWALSLGFVVTTVSACAMVVATLWYALREVRRAEAVLEVEYDRSEALLANIMPTSVAARLKDPACDIVADRYEEASVLFADIAGFTERTSDTNPADLIRFLDRLYTGFDTLVDKYGLEKIKVSGDSYMVVSGVPWPRRDHVEALARLALDMAEAVTGLTDAYGRAVPLRIGLASGPVVAGVVGSRRFFYDVWGDAVNLASRMETTDTEGRIQVPEAIYERLKNEFVLEERGEVDVKGKGVMRTWYLMGRKPDAGPGGVRAEAPQTAGV
jgi:adenylate cyclase